MKKILLSLLMIAGVNLSCFAAQSTMDIYLLAQAQSTTELKKAENIDIVNQDGDTALCSAIKNNDAGAYNILQEAGADTKHKCVNSIPKDQYDTFMDKVAAAHKPWSFLGLGKWGWAAIGAGVVAGGAAAAMGGSSGGGGSAAPATPNKPNDDKQDEPTVSNCIHGDLVDDVCVCDHGYAGALCDAIDDAFIEQDGTLYEKKGCVNGVQQQNTCVCLAGYDGELCNMADSSHIIGDDGKAYPKINCVHGTQDKSVCICDRGYIGELCNTIDVSHIIGDDGVMYPKLNCVNGIQENDICVCSIGYDGPLCDHCINTGADGKCVVVGQEGDNYYDYTTNNGTITIDNESDSVVHGLYSDTSAVNGLGYGSVGSITITNNSDSNVYGICSKDSAYNAFSSGRGLIDITTVGNGDTYGIYSAYSVTNVFYGVGTIRINADTSGNVYGIYGETIAIAVVDVVDKATDNISVIDITSAGSGKVFGVYSANGLGQNLSNGLSTIKINHNSTGDVYAVYGLEKSVNIATPLRGSVAYIDIVNNSTGDAYGLYSADEAVNSDGGIGNIAINNKSSGNAYGIYAESKANSVPEDAYLPEAYSSIVIKNEQTGNVYGIYSGSSAYNNNSERSESFINIANIGSGHAFGIYGTKEISNRGNINIYNLDNGVAIGIYANGATVDNAGIITINRDKFTDGDGPECAAKSDRGGTAIGIYAASGASVNNSGTITINGADTAYGIYAESGAKVTNTGTISIDGVSCDGTTCAGGATYGNHIVLNGATLFQNGVISANTLNLDDMGGNVVAGANAQFVVENEMSGTLTASSDIVSDGFDTTYVAENMIQAGDVSGLNLRSGSAMFDARLADNGNDVVMQMKSFDSLTDNKSLANFLSHNYANGNGAAFFGGLKSGANMAEFNNILNGLSGMNAFTQFDREDMSAMREINFSMNQQMFMNGDRDEYNVSGSMEHFSFSNSSNGGSGSYGISNSRMSDRWKLGYGLAMANIGTNDDFGTNRSNQIGLFYMPMTYTNDSIEFISTPRVGFAKSHYSRRGYNNMNYDGYIEKQIFGFNNDIRYPITFGNWTIAPDLGFNAIMYRQSGHESDQAFSLIIPEDEIYSAEAGLGLFTKYERKLDNGSLRFNSGVMVYRELADTYNMKLGIRGLDGTFNLYDNAEHNYSGAAILGFDYNAGRFSLYGNAQYFVDSDHYMNFKGGISYRF